MTVSKNNACFKRQLEIAIMGPWFLSALLLMATGCRRDQVKVYQVSSDQDLPQQTSPVTATNSNGLPPGHPGASMSANASAQMPSGMVPSDVQNAPPVTWTTPASWTSVPPSEMRAGSFKVAGEAGQTADVSIVPLPGMAGGDFANVNRWRGQAGLQAAPDDELQNSAQTVEAGGRPASLYDIAGQSSSTGRPVRILAAIQHRDGTTWFIKMIGDAGLVQQQEPAFIGFLKSLNFDLPQAQAQLPPGHPDVSGMSTSSTAEEMSSQPNQPDWRVPSDWQSIPAGQFLVAKFKIGGSNGAAAEVNISTCAGDGGGLAANVNRWRGQLGLPPVSEFLTTTFEIPNGQAQLVDLNGKDTERGKSAEIVAIVVMLPGQTWFYKLMGDTSVVAAQRVAFIQFVKSARY